MIDVINLKKSFGSHDVLNGIDITINKGDIVVVIGPSGSGKSTFLRCLNCMEDPTGCLLYTSVFQRMQKPEYWRRLWKAVTGKAESMPVSGNRR